MHTELRNVGAFQLYVALFVLISAANASGELHSVMPSLDELEAKGVVIGTIEIVTDDVFDTNDRKENKSVFRLANHLHITTREGVIRSQLQFSPGERLSAQRILESERLLRQNTFLYDAQIEPTAIRNDVVDIVVRSRDNWTLLPKLSISRGGGENRHSFGIEDQNLLGTGTRIEVERVVDTDRHSTAFEFSDRNLGKSWFGLNLIYRDSDDGTARSFRLSRPFFALTTRWSAGVDLNHDDRIDSAYSFGEVRARYRHDEKLATAWFGWSPGLVNDRSRRIIVGFALADHDFSSASGSEPAPANLGNKSLRYPYLSYEDIEDQYTVTNNLEYIGRTEDVNLGTRYAATLGYLSKGLGGDRSGLLFDAALTLNIGSPDKRLLVISPRIDGRIESGRLRNTKLQLHSEYYWRQSGRRLLYASLNTIVGCDLDAHDLIALGGDTGMRGYPRSYSNGSSLALLTVEQRYFTDWYPFRLFRVGGAAFVDIGRTWGRDILGENHNHVLANAGIGLRMAATRSDGNKVVHIDIAFPLRRPSSIDSIQISIEAKRGF